MVIKWYLIATLICILLIPSEFEHLNINAFGHLDVFSSDLHIFIFYLLDCFTYSWQFLEDFVCYRYQLF